MGGGLVADKVIEIAGFNRLFPEVETGVYVEGFGLSTRRSADTTTQIANGASLSAEIDCGSRVLGAILMPAAWDAANLTFQFATESGGTFVDLYDDAGTEYLVVAAASRAIALHQAAFKNVPFLKIRSGTAALPVNQTDDRDLTLVFSEAL
jgi:hypothetical protein